MSQHTNTKTYWNGCPCLGHTSNKQEVNNQVKQFKKYIIKGVLVKKEKKNSLRNTYTHGYKRKYLDKIKLKLKTQVQIVFLFKKQIDSTKKPS